MNDLRTTSGVVNGKHGAVDGDGGITATPPRVRPEHTTERGGPPRKMSQRQSIVERARREAADVDDGVDSTVLDEPVAGGSDDPDQLALLDDETRERVVNAKLAERASRRSQTDGPNSRPSRRRGADEPAAKSEDGFPWTFHLDDDEEPEKLHASTPLLSRAFRATTG